MPNLIDPNSTIEFGKLKLKDPYSLSTLDSTDYLCAFDATDGELSKTNISAKQIANLKNIEPDGLITDLIISNGTYSFYKYNSSGNKEFTAGVVDKTIYMHFIQIYKSGSTRIFLMLISRSSSTISLQQLASYTSSGARIMCSGYVGSSRVSGIKYAGANSVYAIEGYNGNETTHIIDSSCTITDTTKSI